MEVEVIDGVDWRRERYSNGQLCYEEPFVDGKLHGLRRAWHENGQSRYEEPYVNGEPHGLCRDWHENGQLWYVQLFNNGKLVFEIDNPPQTPRKWKLK